MTAGRVVTLTANPSLDRTLELPAPLVAGGIVR
jgi:1-phosphofructokinase